VHQGQTVSCCWPQARTKLDDTSLIRKILDGDKHAFKELIEKYESRVAATVIGMLGPGPEAEDIGQETFIRFYRALSRFRGESSVGTYVTRIAINLCLNEIRRRGRRRTLYVSNGGERLEAVAHNPGTEHQDESSRLVSLGLQSLAPKFRTVIVLRLIDGYTTRETARILKLEEKRVKRQNALNTQRLEHKKLMMDRENLDYDQLKALLLKDSENKLDLMIESMQLRDEIEAVLTPEQKAALKEMGRDRMGQSRSFMRSRDPRRDSQLRRFRRVPEDTAK